MRIVTHKDILDLNVSPRQCYEWVSYVLEHKKDALLPAKTSMKLDEGVFCNTMPCVVAMPNGKKFGGVKIVTRYPQRKPALDSKLILFDADNGEMKAVMDADWITAMRTGAVAVHSIRLFAKRDFNTVGIIGLGNTARATMLVLSSFCDKKIKVRLLKYKGQEILFAQRFSQFPNFEFEYCDSAEQVVSGSQVVISAVTYLSEDLCSDSAFGKGVLVVPIHTRGFTNCDLFFDKVFADDINHVKHFKYFDKFRSFAEVSDVVCGNAKGRENDDERILAYNIGIALHDVYYAANIYEMLQQKGGLTSVDFLEPTEKFWI